MLLPMSSLYQAKKLIVFNKFMFSEHISLAGASKHDWTNSPSVNGFPHLANKGSTCQLTLVAALFSLLFLWRKLALLRYSCLNLLVFPILASLWIENVGITASSGNGHVTILSAHCSGKQHLKHCGKITRSPWFVMCQSSQTIHKRASAPLCADEALFIKVGIWISQNFHMLQNITILWFFSHIPKQVLACLGLKSIICRRLVYPSSRVPLCPEGTGLVS